MGDYILREIDRIGALLRALLEKAGALRGGPGHEQLGAEVRTEFCGALGMEVDTLVDALCAGDTAPLRRLTDEQGFTAGHFELAGELLADLAAAAGTAAERRRLASAALALYRHLDAAGADAAFNRYYVLRELERYIKQ